MTHVVAMCPHLSLMLSYSCLNPTVGPECLCAVLELLLGPVISAWLCPLLSGLGAHGLLVRMVLLLGSSLLYLP